MDLNLLLGLLLSACIGLSLGLIGGGGSIITVPVLVYVIGIDPRQAVGMSLAVVGTTSIVGAWLHWRKGTVRVREGLLFGGAGVFGAFPGSKLTYLVAPTTLMLLFAGLMVVVASVMLTRKQPAGNSAPRPASNLPRAGAPTVWMTTALEHSSKLPASDVFRAALIGFGVGVLTGFLGVGGGFLIVPSLFFFAGLDMKEAVGTSLLVITVNCAAGLVAHLKHGTPQVSTMLLVTVMAVLGAVAGTSMSHKVSPGALGKGFAVFVLLVAFFLIGKNYSALLR